jgi:hypothetical protein
VRTRYNVETQAPKLLNIIERRICTLAPTGMASQACNESFSPARVTE